MARSEQINELAVALAKAQGSITHANKDCENPFHKSKYADLASVWEACRKQLAENGLSVVQLPDGMEENCLILDTTMLHSSGQWVSSRIKMPMPKQDPQGYGSALTYARRYALAAMVGVYQDDDDANGALPQKPQPPKPVPPKDDNLITDKQLSALVNQAKEYGITNNDMKTLIKWKFNVDSSKKLSKKQAGILLGSLIGAWEEYARAQGQIAATSTDDEILNDSIKEGK